MEKGDVCALYRRQRQLSRLLGRPVCLLHCPPSSDTGRLSPGRPTPLPAAVYSLPYGFAGRLPHACTESQQSIPTGGIYSVQLHAAQEGIIRPFRVLFHRFPTEAAEQLHIHSQQAVFRASLQAPSPMEPFPPERRPPMVSLLLDTGKRTASQAKDGRFPLPKGRIALRPPDLP